MRVTGCLTLFAGLALAIGLAGQGGPAGVEAARAAVPHAQTVPQPPVDVESSPVAVAPSESVAPQIVTASSSAASELGLAKISDRYPASGLAADGIPVTALDAYQQAARREALLAPQCGLSWPLLAGIGRVESDHGRFAGAVLHSDGLSTPRVIGIPLNGQGTALILDTDGGALDGDTVYDRAVGPMQFIPSTWAGWGVDANGDGVKDPFNIFDAAAAAADYLCAAGRDLTTTHGQVQAILSYNWSWDYVTLVMGVERVYASGAVGITVPVLPTSPDPGGRPGHPKLPPVDPGKPRGVGSGTTSQPTSPAPQPTSSTRPAPSSSVSQPGSGSGSSSSSASASSTPGSSSPAPSSSVAQPCSSESAGTPSPDPTCPPPSESSSASSPSDSSSVSSPSDSASSSTTAAQSSDAPSGALASGDPSSTGP